LVVINELKNRAGTSFGRQYSRAAFFLSTAIGNNQAPTLFVIARPVGRPARFLFASGASRPVGPIRPGCRIACRRAAFFALTRLSGLCYASLHNAERPDDENAGKSFQKNLVVADQKCLPISSIN